MAPEKKYALSSVFTVRLSFGSVTSAAVITFIGLAWMFFLGAMVGRLSYDIHGVSTPNILFVVLQNSALNVTNDTKPSKTDTIYYPTLKENRRFEQVITFHSKAQELDFVEKLKDTTSKQKSISTNISNQIIASSEAVSSKKSQSTPYYTVVSSNTYPNAIVNQEYIHSKFSSKIDANKKLYFCVNNTFFL